MEKIGDDCEKLINDYKYQLEKEEHKLNFKNVIHTLNNIWELADFGEDNKQYKAFRMVGNNEEYTRIHLTPNLYHCEADVSFICGELEGELYDYENLEENIGYDFRLKEEDIMCRCGNYHRFNNNLFKIKLEGNKDYISMCVKCIFLLDYNFF